MGFNYRKYINLGKGFRINLTQKGAGVSFGAKGARVTVNKDGVRGRVGVPGTKASYTKQKSFKKGSTAKKVAGIIATIVLLVVIAYYLVGLWQ